MSRMEHRSEVKLYSGKWIFTGVLPTTTERSEPDSSLYSFSGAVTVANSRCDFGCVKGWEKEQTKRADV